MTNDFVKRVCTMNYLVLIVCVASASAELMQMKAGLQLAKNLPGVVIDVGANGGKETKLALSYGRKVVAVECLASAYAKLLKEYGALNTVVVLHVCASASTSVQTLYLADDSSSLIANNVASGAERQKALRAHNVLRHNREMIVTAPLDDLITNSSQVALIKMDVQGAEPQVFQGAARIIKQNRPVLIYEDNPGFAKLSQIELPPGYRCRVINGDKVCNFN
ncbi:MAG: hypothetical protein CL678_16480 [Bdellovibrionaceae bacterium]|nr:hypothetical protein [Pseudobdellovibrionaceae bacterium]